MRSANANAVQPNHYRKNRMEGVAAICLKPRTSVNLSGLGEPAEFPTDVKEVSDSVG